MPVQGPLSFGTSADSAILGPPPGSHGVNWTLTGSPGTPQSGTIATGASTHYLVLNNFGFTIPTPPGGDGVQSINAQITTTTNQVFPTFSAKDNSLFLVVEGVLAGGEQSIGATCGGTQNYPNNSGNDPGFVWGPGTLYTDVNRSDFGLAYSVIDNTGGGSVTVTSATITVTIGLIEFTVSAGGAGIEGLDIRRQFAWSISPDGSTFFGRLPSRLRDYLIGAWRETGACAEQLRDELAGFHRRGVLWLPVLCQTRSLKF